MQRNRVSLVNLSSWILCFHSGQGSRYDWQLNCFCDICQQWTKSRFSDLAIIPYSFNPICDLLFISLNIFVMSWSHNAILHPCEIKTDLRVVNKQEGDLIIRSFTLLQELLIWFLARSLSHRSLCYIIMSFAHLTYDLRLLWEDEGRLLFVSFIHLFFGCCDDFSWTFFYWDIKFGRNLLLFNFGSLASSENSLLG